MALMQASPADLQRRTALNRMRGVALALLIAAALIFLATLPVAAHGGWGWLHAAAEAAMVGGLADWFAVTALFRHPLGLPVPHTAIIPRRKDELGRQLQSFVNENFLTEALITERLGELGVTRRAGEWLADAAHRRQVADLLARAAEAGLARLDDEDVVRIVGDAVLPRLATEPFAPVVGTLLDKIVADGGHEPLVDLVLSELHTWLEANPDAFADAMGGRAPRWTPRWVDRRVIDYAYRQVLTWVEEIRDTPHHAARLALTRFATGLAQDLQHDDAIMERFGELQRRLLAHPQVLASVGSLVASLRHVAAAALADRDGLLWQRTDAMLADAAARLSGDPELQERLDARVTSFAAWLVRNYGDQLTRVISLTIERWDPRQASRRIELFVGRDLQFIRINGTVVGALVGVIIHGVTVLLGG